MPAPSFIRRLTDLWERAKREHSTPREIGVSVGLGAFAACTPFIGFHLGIAALLATIFRVNRLWAMIASRLSTSPVLVLTTFLEIQTAHRLRTGTWATVPVHEISLGWLWHNTPQLLVDWAVGCVIVGSLIAVAVGAAAYAVARRWQQLNPRELSGLHRPSSESPQ